MLFKNANPFELPVARTLLDVPPTTEHGRLTELKVIIKLKQFLMSNDVDKILQAAPGLDKALKRMSGAGLLIAGQMVCKACPEALAAMPGLAATAAHLTRSQRLSDVFRPAALARIAKSLRES